MFYWIIYEELEKKLYKFYIEYLLNGSLKLKFLSFLEEIKMKMILFAFININYIRVTTNVKKVYLKYVKSTGWLIVFDFHIDVMT